MMRTVRAPLTQIVFDGKLVCSVRRIPASNDTILRMFEHEGIIIPGGIVLPELDLNDWKNENWDEPSEPSDTYTANLEQFDQGYMAQLLEPLGIRVRIKEFQRINYWDGNFSKLVNFTLYEQFALFNRPLDAEEQATLFQILPPGYGSMDTSRLHATYFPIGKYECGGLFLHAFG